MRSLQVANRRFALKRGITQTVGAHHTIEHRYQNVQNENAVYDKTFVKSQTHVFPYHYRTVQVNDAVALCQNVTITTIFTIIMIISTHLPSPMFTGATIAKNPMPTGRTPITDMHMTFDGRGGQPSGGRHAP
jgi:hypothetical protein